MTSGRSSSRSARWSSGEARNREIKYEGRTLVTNELIESMKIKLPLLQNGFGAISYYRELVERACRVQGHPRRARTAHPAVHRGLLFGQKVQISDPQVVARLGDDDVREYIQAVFIDLVRKKITRPTSASRSAVRNR